MRNVALAALAASDLVGLGVADEAPTDILNDPVGAKRTALELLNTGRIIPTPDDEAVSVTFALFHDKFAAQGFTSRGQIATTVIDRAPGGGLWAVSTDYEISDDAVFIRID